MGRHAGARKQPRSTDPLLTGGRRRGGAARPPVWLAGLAMAALVAPVAALVIHQQARDLAPVSRTAALSESHPHGDVVATKAGRTGPRYAVRRGVTLTPRHPAFYALSQRMTHRGFVFRHSAKGMATSFRVTTMNVLGAGHTDGKGGFASGPARMHAAVGLLMGNDVSVAGLQEFQAPQFHTFESLVGGVYDAYPGLSLGEQPVQNSIIWRRSDWSLVEAHTLSIPYFFGNHVPMPYVLLRNLHSGREVWFYNTHNPADAHGPAGKWRAIATSSEAALARQLTADGTPMIVTGDMNDREPFACRFAAGSGMHSADGAYSFGGCHLPARMNVDWIFGSSNLSFSGFVTDFSTKARRISDHPMVRSDVTLPAVVDPRCHRAPGFGWFCPKR